MDSQKKRLTPEQIQKRVKLLQDYIRVEGLLRPKKKGD
jgi:hypothetical protein